MKRANTKPPRDPELSDWSSVLFCESVDFSFWHTNIYENPIIVKRFSKWSIRLLALPLILPWASVLVLEAVVIYRDASEDILIPLLIHFLTIPIFCMLFPLWLMAYGLLVLSRLRRKLYTEDLIVTSLERERTFQSLVSALLGPTMFGFWLFFAGGFLLQNIDIVLKDDLPGILKGEYRFLAVTFTVMVILSGLLYLALQIFALYTVRAYLLIESPASRLKSLFKDWALSRYVLLVLCTIVVLLTSRVIGYWVWLFALSLLIYSVLSQADLLRSIHSECLRSNGDLWWFVREHREETRGFRESWPAFLDRLKALEMPAPQAAIASGNRIAEKSLDTSE